MKRDLQQVVDDFLWPQGALQVNSDVDRRHQALEVVLRQIPERDYDRLKELVDTFHWFIPFAEEHARLMPFHATVYPPEKAKGLSEAPYAQVLCLMSNLEKSKWDIVVGAIAHELAHLILGHQLHPKHGIYETQEREAWTLIETWGFERESKKCQAVHKWREARDETEYNKLLREAGLEKPV
jgi:hypothetical protein